MGDAQKSQEELGLEPFRNCVSSWQSWLSTGGQNNKAPRPWLALLSQAKPALCGFVPQVLLILLSWRHVAHGRNSWACLLKGNMYSPQLSWSSVLVVGAGVGRGIPES